MLKIRLLLWLLLPFQILHGQASVNQAQTADAALRLIASLNTEQKAQALLDFNDPDRQAWSNLPFEQVERKGIRMDALNDAQRQLVHALLRTVLSQQGYQKVLFIMQYDDGIKSRLTKAGNPIAHRYSHEHYWLTIFGTPAVGNTWGWQFEGHHISLNLTHAPTGVKCSPMFMGINPALTTEGVNAGQYLMAEENETGKWLLNSLSAVMKSKAVVDTLPANVDVMAQKGNETFLTEKRGIAYRDMNKAQQKAVSTLIKAWVFNMNEDIATVKWQRISKQLNNTRFVWLGDGNTDHLHYFRLVSPVMCIEMTNRDGGMYHFHSLWRELGNE